MTTDTDTEPIPATATPVDPAIQAIREDTNI
jgi:hypothetical protein